MAQKKVENKISLGKPNHIPIFAICIIAVLAIIAVASVILLNLSKSKYDQFKTVAMINGMPVAAGELKIYFDEVKTDVFTYFKQTYGIEFDKDFWTSQINGEIPLNTAIDMAVKKLTPIKIEQSLFLEHGIIADAGYKSFIDTWNGENKRRASGKEVIFGPEQYTEAVYYNYLHTNRKNELQAAMRENGVYTAGSDELEAIYGEHKDSTDDTALALQEQYFIDAYNQNINSLCENAIVEIDSSAYDQMLKALR